MEKVTNEQEFWAFMAKLNAEREQREAVFRAESEARWAKNEAQFAKTEAQMAETDLKIKALAKQTAKTDAQLAKTDAQLAKTDAQLAKTDAQLAKTDAQLSKMDAQMLETDLKLKALIEQTAKTDIQLAKTDAKLAKVAALLGNVNNNRGEEAEEFFYRSLEKEPRIANIHFDSVHRNWSSTKGKVSDEFDLLLVNGDMLALIEVKTKAHVDLVNRLVNKKIPNFKILFPHAQQYKLFAGIATLVTYPELIEAAQQAGLFVLTQRGQHLELIEAPIRDF